MAYLFWPHKQECETSVPGPKRINRLNKRPAMSEHLALYAGLFLHCPLPNFTGQTVRTSELTGNKALLVRIFFDARFAGSIIAMSVDISGFLQACSTSIVATLLAIPSPQYSGSSTRHSDLGYYRITDASLARPIKLPCLSSVIR